MSGTTIIRSESIASLARAVGRDDQIHINQTWPENKAGSCLRGPPSHPILEKEQGEME